ncbi:MAG: hypothetical protein HZC10_03130 [Nitrospirae bacterium]|nr:hypothetical protein [Nitrospirota bacterium]
MKKLLIAVFLSIATLLPYSIVFAEEGIGDKFILELEGRYWMPKLSANLKLSDYNVYGVEIVGTDINVVDDLGIKNENFFSGRLILKLGNSKIRFSYLPIRYEGEKAVPIVIDYGGSKFAQGTTVKTKLKADMYDLTYEYDALKTDLGFLGIIIGVKYFDLYGSLEGTETVLGTTVKEEKDGQVPIPVIGLAGRVYPIKYFNISGEITGLTVGKASIYDAEAAININPIQYVGISGGYRIIRFSAEGDNEKDKATLRLHGPFVALMLRF